MIFGVPPLGICSPSNRNFLRQAQGFLRYAQGGLIVGEYIGVNSPMAVIARA
jgi:hypothetical protein